MVNKKDALYNFFKEYFLEYKLDALNIQSVLQYNKIKN